jgi:hypothetical protein
LPTSSDLDLTESLAPKSDQLDAVDLIGSPRTFTITKVTRGNSDQPFNYHLAEFPRVWRPGKSMRRVLAAAWGVDASKHVGQRVTLYCDPSVQFGGEATGGTRISHMSGIDKPLKVPLLVKRGKSAMFTVQPLTEPAPQPKPEPIDWNARISEAKTVDALRNLWSEASNAGADPKVLDAIKAAATAAAQN